MNKLDKIMENASSESLIEKELDSIKKLLVLLLIKAGATQDEIGAALGRERSGISKMFPGLKIKKFDKL
jgi:ParB-like chromosome segregation protein Spo0J